MVDQEAQLIDQARRGSVDAFAQIVRRYQARVRAYVAGHLMGSSVADDLSQEVFLAAFRYLGGYRGEAALGTWLLSIARNQIISYLRTETRRHQREGKSLEALLLPMATAAADEDETELAQREREIMALQRCVERLAPASAKVVRDHYFGARSIVDIASDLGKQAGSVRMLLLRARAALHECIERNAASETLD